MARRHQVRAGDRQHPSPAHRAHRREAGVVLEARRRHHLPGAGIGAVLLDINFPGIGWGKAEELREAIKDLRESGLLKVKQGLTTIEEVLGATNE